MKKMAGELYMFVILSVPQIWRYFSKKHPEHRAPGQSIVYLSPSSLRSPAKHFEIGVGVYQGEAVIYHWRKEEPPLPSYWVSRRLRYYDLPRIDRRVAPLLRRLAFALQDGKQSYHSLTDLQRSRVIGLDRYGHQPCPLNPLPVSLAAGGNDSEKSQRPPAQELRQTPECPKYLECPYLNLKGGESG